MGCHCREISIMRHDIGVIGSSISKLNNITTSSEQILSSIKESAENLYNNIDITNKENVISTLEYLSIDEPYNISNSVAECTSYKFELQQRLDDMIISDRDYHEEQERKRNHND